MSPMLVTLLVGIAVALLLARQIVWERRMRRARATGTGISRFSPPVRRVIVIVLMGVDIATWH